MEENRKLKLEVKRLQRAEAEAWTSKNIVSMKLERCKAELDQERKKHSGKRLRIPNPNYKVFRAVRIANSGPHSPVQQTGPDPTSEPTMGSK